MSDERRPIFRTLLKPQPVAPVHSNLTVYFPDAQLRALVPVDVLLLGPGAAGEFLLLGPGPGVTEVLALGPGIP